MSDASLPLGQKEADHDRIAIEAEQICPACEQALWVSFYFDGFGYSDKEGSRTNIVKLYQAAYEDPGKGMLRFYYPGLGAHFDPETAALAVAVGGRLAHDVSGNAEGAAWDSAKDQGKGLLEAAGDSWKKSRAKGGSLLDSAGEALGGAWEAGGKKVRKSGHAVKRVIRDPRAFAEKKLRRLRWEWRDFWRELTRHPIRSATGGALKQVGKTVASNTAGAAAEGMSVLRDATLAAGLFNTGVDTRLEAAERDFKAAVAQARHVSRLNHINVALFGYDMGGGLALAFCKRLLQETCSGGRYEGTTVRIRFMGLFDCVTNRYEDNWLTGFMPMSNAVSSELLLPDEVERCVHYAAAHELRFYKPLTIIGADPEDFRGKRQEQLFPGSQEDVGGGVEAGEEGVSDQLARYPLQMMYNRAYGAGVPMPSLPELRNVDPRLYVELQPSKEVENFQRAYRRAVKSLVTVTRVIDPSLMRLQDLSCTMPVLAGASSANAGCYIPPQPLKVTELPRDVEAQYKGHIAVYIQWLRMWYDQNAGTAGEREGVFGLGAPVDPQAHARYEKLADELAYVERNARSAPGFDMVRARDQLDGKVPPSMFSTDPQAQALYWIWNNRGQRLPEVEALYPGFLAHVHDSMAESALESAFGTFVMAKHYFNRRPMQRLATRPDPGFLEKLEGLYERMFD